MEAKSTFQPTSTVTVKVALNNVFRRFSFDGGYAALTATVATVFGLSLGTFSLKYTDDESDLITLDSDRDLVEAKRISGSLVRLTVVAATPAPVAPAVVPSVVASNAIITPCAVTERKHKGCKKEKKSDTSSSSSDEGRKKKHDKKRSESSSSSDDSQKKKEKEERKAQKRAEKDLKREAKKETPKSDAKEANDHHATKEAKKAEKEAKHQAKEAMKVEKEAKKAEWIAKKAECKAKCEARRALKDAKPETKEDQDAKVAKKAEWKAKREARRQAGEAKPGKGKKLSGIVADVTIEGRSDVLPGASFVKTWRFRNESTQAWPAGSKLVFLAKKRRADRMSGPEEVPVPVVEAGAEADVSVNLVAPQEPGHYVGFWRLVAPDGSEFGQKAKVRINVPSTPAASSPVVEQARPAAPQVDASPEWAAQLDQLKQMGFDNQKLNLRLLKRFNGDLSAVLDKLVQTHPKKMTKADI